MIVSRDPPNVSGIQDLMGWVHWAWHPKRIRLDDLGSFVWQRCDGRATLGGLADAVRAEFPDPGEDIEGRVRDFVAALGTLGLLRID